MACYLNALKFPELQRFPRGKRSLKVEIDSVDPPVVIITNSNEMNPAAICKYTLASDQHR